MNRSAIVGFLVGVAVTAAAAYLAVNKPTAVVPPPPAVNRYQMSITANGTVYVFDAATGHLWIWQTAWSDQGTPPAGR